MVSAKIPFPLSSHVSLIEVLVKATPLLLTGAGVLNLGIEGTMFLGAFG